MISIGMTACTGKQIPIHRPAAIRCQGVALLARIECNRVVLIDGLAIQDRFEGLEVIIEEGLFITAGINDVMSVLAHVE
jgi:hypothetical protein